MSREAGLKRVVSRRHRVSRVKLTVVSQPDCGEEAPPLRGANVVDVARVAGEINVERNGGARAFDAALIPRHVRRLLVVARHQIRVAHLPGRYRLVEPHRAPPLGLAELPKVVRLAEPEPRLALARDPVVVEDRAHLVAAEDEEAPPRAEVGHHAQVLRDWLDAPHRAAPGQRRQLEPCSVHVHQVALRLDLADARPLCGPQVIVSVRGLGQAVRRRRVGVLRAVAVVEHLEDHALVVPAEREDDLTEVVAAGNLRKGRALEDGPRVAWAARPGREAAAVLRAQRVALLEGVRGDPERAAHRVRGLEVRLLALRGRDVELLDEVEELRAVERDEVAVPERAVHPEEVRARLREENVLGHAADAHREKLLKHAHVALQVNDVRPDDDGLEARDHEPVGVGGVVECDLLLHHVRVDAEEARAGAGVGHGEVREGPKRPGPGHERAVAALAALRAGRRGGQRREDAARGDEGGGERNGLRRLRERQRRQERREEGARAHSERHKTALGQLCVALSRFF